MIRESGLKRKKLCAAAAIVL